MEIKNQLQISQQQRLALTPELKQSITVLQLPIQELENYLQEQLTENPVLDLEKQDVEADNDTFDVEGDDTEQWLEYFADRSDLGIAKGERTERKESFETAAEAKAFELNDYLREQALLTFSREELSVAFFIIANIDTDGYLRMNDAEAITNLKVSKEFYYSVLAKIRQFEPAGVAASSLEECLLLQVERSELAPDIKAVLARLVSENLEEIAAAKVLGLAKKFKVAVQVMQDYLDTLKKFNPHPGAGFASEATIYLLPDLVIDKVNDQFTVRINENNLPKLVISNAYLKILNSNQDEQTKKYIREKVTGAAALIHSIEERRLTLYKIANVIVEWQHDFLEKGEKYLKPLIYQDVAERVNLHQSTVSRAIANKYVQTPQGVFPMKHFFSGGLATDNGSETAVAAIKERIKKLIASENTAKPLSDQQIAELLISQGVNISRRTVAKYREQMKINTSSKRKRY